ncbi:MAG: AAA family ATPase [Bacteroidia bacterium]|nr:AAA family ATPase [Bacteroidia bacterium]
MDFIKTTAFINRLPEFDFLSKWISEQPDNILFIYGPKSSGKTTLLYKFIEHKIDSKKYPVKFFNLREILIANYTDFINLFFSRLDSAPEKEVRSKYEYDLKVFKISFETLRKLEKKEIDPLWVMKKELLKENEKGRHPLLIIDELQALSGIYMNSQRELINELFNFFVAITKESHLCHVAICSSDGYFIDRIYTDSKLMKTSRFLEVDYLQKNHIEYWLNNLDTESNITTLKLTKQQIQRIWHYFGGSVWEISVFLSRLLIIAREGKVNDTVLENEAVKDIKAFCVRFHDYRFINFDEKFLIDSYRHFKEKGFLTTLLLSKKYTKNKLQDELGNLVSKNLFSYNPRTGEFKPQGQSVYLGLEMYCREIAQKNNKSI